MRFFVSCLTRVTEISYFKRWVFFHQVIHIVKCIFKFFIVYFVTFFNIEIINTFNAFLSYHFFYFIDMWLKFAVWLVSNNIFELLIHLFFYFLLILLFGGNAKTFRCWIIDICEEFIHLSVIHNPAEGARKRLIPVRYPEPYFCL